MSIVKQFSNFSNPTTSTAANLAMKLMVAITGLMPIEKIATMELAICILLLVKLKMLLP